MAADVQDIIRQLSEKFEKSSRIELVTDKGIELKVQVLPNVTERADTPIYLRKGSPAVFTLERSGVPTRIYHSLEAVAKAISYES